MEGICVAVHWDDAVVDSGAVERMAAAAPHRGRSVQRTLQRAQLAHQSVGTTVPHVATRAGLTVVASARIDNRAELLPHLPGVANAADATEADVILAAHERWGSNAPAHLIGDFAYVAYDSVSRTLLAVRDPMGMRPLYVHNAPRRTYLASEIAQILATGYVAVEVDEAAVARHLIDEFGVLDATFYRGIQSILPGHVLRIDAAGERHWRFWDVDPAHEVRFAREEDYAERFRELFIEAVRSRLTSTSRIGLLLSGGVDSGSIASTLGALMERGHEVPPVDTFSLAFREHRECDERHLSSIVVERYGLRSHAVAAEGHEPLAGYPAHGPHRDEPFMIHYQGLLETALSASRELGVTHMWSGDRGDVVGGRAGPTYRGHVRGRRWRDLLTALGEHAALTREPAAVIGWRHVVRPLARDIAVRWRAMPRSRTAVRPDDRCPPWLASGLLERTGVKCGESTEDIEFPAGLPSDRGLRYQLVFTPKMMRGALWVERTNAAFGQGFVDPWSDRRLAAYVIAIPQVVLNRPPGPNKRLTRAAMRGLMPDELRAKATKIVPISFYHHAVRATQTAVVADLTTDMLAEHWGFVDAAALRRHHDAFLTGATLHPTFWYALTLEMWLRAHHR